MIIAVNTTDEENVKVHRLYLFARPPVGAGSSQAFSIVIRRNTPPSFLASLKDQKLAWNDTETYTLPLYKDIENDVYISAALDGLSYLPLFINFKPSKRRFTFTPEQKHVGTYTIRVTLTESTGYASVSETFQLFVIDSGYGDFNSNALWMNASVSCNEKGDAWINFSELIHNYD